MKKIAVIGAGYVGLAAALSSAANYEVELVESNEDRFNKLKIGKIPMVNEEFQSAMDIHYPKIKFLKSISQLSTDLEVILVCVGTPSSVNGDLEMKYLESAFLEIAETNIDSSAIILIKSTINIGVTESMAELVKNPVAFCPEFLRESTELQDYNNPDRVVVGFAKSRSTKLLKDRLEDYFRNSIANYDSAAWIYVSATSAEIIKLASNSYLAMRLAFFNELSILCENTPANIDDVMIGVTSDTRIGSKYANTGIGFSGPCLPKDTKSLSSSIRKYTLASVLDTVLRSNELTYYHTLKKIEKLPKGAILFIGISFKAFSDDVRDSLSYKLYQDLASKGNDCRIFDPRSGYPEIDYSEIYSTVIISTPEYADILDAITYHNLVDIKDVRSKHLMPHADFLGK